MNDHLAKIASARPMLVVASAFIIGLIVEDIWHVGSVIIISLILLLLISSFISKNDIRSWSLLGLIVLSGVLRLQITDINPPGSLDNYQIKPGDSYVCARVIEIGETRKGTPKYILVPLSIDNNNIHFGKMILYSKDITSIPEIGDTLYASMTLQKPRGKRNPHDFDYRTYLGNQDIFIEAFITDTTTIKLHPAAGFITGRMIRKIRESIKQHYNNYLSPGSAGIMSALILGERSDVNDSTRKDFANTGVIHVLAVSGLHVGYVSLILITILGMLRFQYRPKLILVILGLGGYVILTSGAASVMRASIMASLILLASLLERKTDVFNILATAAIVILLIDPGQIKSIGFQLSFSAVFSIVMLFPVFRTWTPKIIIPGPMFINSITNGVVDLFLVSLAAQLGTLAITVYYFHKIPIISLIANLVVVPLIGLIVATGISSLILGSIFPILAELWAALLDSIIEFMLYFVKICASINWAYYSTASIDILEVIMIIAAIFSMTFIHGNQLLKLWIILLLVWMNYEVWPGAINPGKMELVMLDVGQGDGAIIHTPLGKTIVVDAGSRFSGKDMGRDVISPYLMARNWKNIDLLVLTHPHNDHMGGAEYLLKHHSVQRVIMPRIEYDSYGYRRLIETLDSLDTSVQASYMGDIDTTLLPLYIRTMGPKRFEPGSEPHNVNNVSVVLQMFYGETSLLLTGDAEYEMEAEQLALGELLKSDIIKAPHHGSKTSSTTDYIKYIDPNVCLMSLGEGNKYRHPSPITTDRYQEMGTKIHRTDLEGAIVYKSDGRKWRHSSWKAEMD